MGLDFTSFKYPFDTLFMEIVDGEGHLEPASESFLSNVVGAEHPLFSSSGIKNLINRGINLSTSNEDLIQGEISNQVFKDLINLAYKHQFPFELLTMVADLEQKLDQRSGATDVEKVISKMTSSIQELKQTLGRQPFYHEVFMSHMLGSVANVKKIIDNAKNNPNEEAVPLGTKYDDSIFYKSKLGNKLIRTNKQVLQFFIKRVPLGANVFPHLPLGVVNGN